jgi:hypothetical protein
VLGRFLSADPFVGDAGDSQEYNRYSYLGNNPLGGTDPSGYFSLKDAAKVAAVVVAAVVTAGVAVYGMAVLAGQAVTLGNAFGALVGAGGWSLTGYGAVTAGAAGGFASGFAGSLLNGGSIGDAFKAGAIGGIVGGITGGLAFQIGGSDLGYFGRAAAHGAVQGGAAELQGGEFRHGFYSGFATAAASPGIGTIDSKAGQVFAAAAIGGTASAIGGGKFANGAVSGAFQYLLNDTQHNMSSRAEAARNHGPSIMYDVGGGADMFSDISMSLTYPAGANLDAIGDEIYKGLKRFDGFNNSKRFGVVLGDGAATFFDKFAPTPATVRLTAYNSARVLVGDTGGLHFLVGSRNWRVFQSSPNQLTVATGAVEHFNGAINRAAAVAIGFRGGGQHKIWTEYFSTIAASQSLRHGAINGGFRIVEKKLP